jgi:hypothetical protein
LKFPEDMEEIDRNCDTSNKDKYDESKNVWIGKI